MAEPLQAARGWSPQEAAGRLRASGLHVVPDPEQDGATWRWLGTPEGFVLARVAPGLQDIEIFPEVVRIHAVEGLPTWGRTTFRLTVPEPELPQRAAEHLAREGAPGVWVGEREQRWIGWLGAEKKDYTLVGVRDGRLLDTCLILRSTVMGGVTKGSAQ